MTARVLMTGIPSQYTRLIKNASGSKVWYRERVNQPTSKREFMLELSAIRNTGNYLIGEGALQCVTDGAVHVPFWHLSHNIENSDFVHELRENFDLVLFSAANLLRTDLDAEMEAVVLERLNLPTVVLGLGLQRRADLNQTLPPGTLRFLELLKSPNNFTLTRGTETSDFLRRCGITNNQPAGCPSIYLEPDNMVRALELLPKITFGTTQRASFLGHLGETGDAMMDMNELTLEGNTSRYVIQDEPLIFNMQFEANEDEQVYDPASGRILAPVRFPKQTFLKRELALYCFFDPAQWRVWNSCFDFCFSRRFHGAVAAMQAGVPAVMVCIDDRMVEMANFAGFPYLSRGSWNEEPDKASALRAFLAQVEVSKAVDIYRSNEESFRTRLRMLGLS